ncbi:MAG: regulatory protein FmdB family [Friedmanniella sp.]|nr:regulatory protein FmdB family [Friedmanniella sp.]
MPTYQYRCTECGHDLEAVQKFTDSALTECPSCGGSLRKIFNAVGVVFKGSGFYRTDSRTGKASDSGPSEKSEAKREAKKDASAPAATSDTGSNGSSSSGSGSNGSSANGSGASGSGSSSAPKVASSTGSSATS